MLRSNPRAVCGLETGGKMTPELPTNLRRPKLRQLAGNYSAALLRLFVFKSTSSCDKRKVLLRGRIEIIYQYKKIGGVSKSRMSKKFQQIEKIILSLNINY